MVHPPMDLRQQVARLADQVGLDFQAEREVGSVAGLRDAAELVGGFLQPVQLQQKIANSRR